MKKIYKNNCFILSGIEMNFKMLFVDSVYILMFQTIAFI